MAVANEEWSCDANEAITISLVRPGADGSLKTDREFHPKFTYPIFGEAEQIFGYKGLSIDIKFAAHDGSSSVDVQYDRKFPQVKSTTALDVRGTLKDFLPERTFWSPSGFQEQIQNDQEAGSWKPPGTLVQTYSRDGREFEIWAGSLLNPRVQQLVDNIQIFVLFFIEAGSYLNTDDVDWTLDRWRVYFVYEKGPPTTPTASPYSLVGYATTYRFYQFISPRQQTKSTSKPGQPSTGSSLSSFPKVDKITPKEMTSRLRISQFLILPPYQSSGHGTALYEAIYSEVVSDATITEMTVEDPSEEFDRLRDSCDWKVLEPELRAAGVKISASAVAGRRRIGRVPTGAILPVDTLKAIRVNNKIAARQFARQVELYLLSLIPFSHRASGGASLTKLKIHRHTTKNPDDQIYYWWRILLKQRIFKKNRDVLQQLEAEDKYPKIEDSARGQEDEYEGLLMLFALRQAKLEDRVSDGRGGPSSSTPRKRKVVEDDDEDEEDVEEMVVPKRRKP